MLELVKLRLDKETGEENPVPLFLYKEDIMCLYGNSGKVFIVTREGFMHKVPYKLKELQEHLGL